MISFVAALFYTTVANVTVIYAMSPLMAAVLARFLIGDPLVARTLVAFTVALAGIAVMVGASFGTGRLFGDFLALVMSATFAVVIVEMRRKPDIDNLTSSLLTSLADIRRPSCPSLRPRRSAPTTRSSSSSSGSPAMCSASSFSSPACGGCRRRKRG